MKIQKLLWLLIFLSFSSWTMEFDPEEGRPYLDRFSKKPITEAQKPIPEEPSSEQTIELPAWPQQSTEIIEDPTYSSMESSLSKESATIKQHIEQSGQSGVMQKWNTLKNKIKETLSKITQDKALVQDESTLKLLPKELKTAEEKINTVKEVDSTLFATNTKNFLQQWLMTHIEDWMASPSRAEQLEVYRKQWLQSYIENAPPTINYSEDKFIQAHFDADSFKKDLSKALSYYIKANYHTIAPDNLQKDPHLDDIIETLNKIGFLESKVFAIKAILESDIKRENYTSTQLQQLKKDQSLYKENLSSLYASLGDLTKSWGNDLKSVKLKALLQDNAKLKQLSQEYTAEYSHYRELFKELEDFDKELQQKE